MFESFTEGKILCSRKEIFKSIQFKKEGQIPIIFSEISRTEHLYKLKRTNNVCFNKNKVFSEKLYIVENGFPGNGTFRVMVFREMVHFGKWFSGKWYSPGKGFPGNGTVREMAFRETVFREIVLREKSYNPVILI